MRRRREPNAQNASNILLCFLIDANARTQPWSDAKPPSWDTVKPTASARFKVLSAFNNEAVLDKETGLVWETQPSATTRTWTTAMQVCMGKTVGGRMGWRSPSVEELTSLVGEDRGSSRLVRSRWPIGERCSLNGRMPMTTRWTLLLTVAGILVASEAHAADLFTSPLPVNAGAFVSCYAINAGTTPLDISVELRDPFGELFGPRTCVASDPGDV
jgi:hypothetical protein